MSAFIQILHLVIQRPTQVHQMPLRIEELTSHGDPLCGQCLFLTPTTSCPKAADAHLKHLLQNAASEYRSEKRGTKNEFSNSHEML